MLEAAPTVKWECRDCKTYRDEPSQFVGPGAPACPRCCNAMTPVPAPVLVGSTGIIRDTLDLDHAIGTMASAPAMAVDELLHSRDPDLVLEPDEDGLSG